MESLTIETSRPYEIIIAANILHDLGSLLQRQFSYSTLALISDDTVFSLYGKTVVSALRQSGFKVKTFLFPHGEASKNMTTYTAILEFLAQEKISRSDALIALGGGVVGDITGFAAATYLRGVDYIQVPTTFLASVDAAVGGKTAVNLDAGKNLAGAFHQPVLVYCDIDTLQTLPPERFHDGTAEALKYGVLCDKQLFNLLATANLQDHLEEVIFTSLKIKRNLVQADEFDTGQRQLLNLGHTIGHAIEKESNFSISHGKAVAIGMVAIAKVAKDQGLSAEDCETPLVAALEKYGLPTLCPYSLEKLIGAMAQDKKRNGERINFVIPKAIGQCILWPVKTSELSSFLGVLGGSDEH